MPQKIKNQIRKTIPWFVIIALIVSTSVISFVFNFNFGVYQRSNQDISLNISLPEAQADSATTSVTVRNAAPVFVGNAAELDVSTSTSPVNIGESIRFTATANDPEDNSFYLIVCSSDSVVPNVSGGWPSCTDTTFCTSTLTADLGAATCAYQNVADPPGEIDDWWGFVCDNHNGEADCSSSDQGASPNLGDDSSPFYVNHAATIVTATTSVDYLAPGSAFTYTATTTDQDTYGGYDEISMYICDAGGFATSTGCGGTEFCAASSTPVGNGTTSISCQWTDTAPTVDQTYPYFVYIVDWHGLAGSNNAYPGFYTIINVAPSITNVKLLPNNGANILLNIKGATSTLVYASSTTVTDQNGCADIQSATGTIYWESKSGGYNCASDNNDCYPIGSAGCTISNCVGAVAEATCSSTIEFFALPTDSSSWGASSTTWLASIRAFDEALSGIGTSSPGTDIQTNTALDVTEIGIDYGTLRAGQDTGTSTATTTVINYGNSPLDTNISGTWMVDGAYTIFSTYQEHDLAYQFAYGGGTSLSSTTPDLIDTVITRPNSATDVVDNIYWGIGLPLTQHSGTYYGTNTIAAVIDDSGNWFP